MSEARGVIGWKGKGVRVVVGVEGSNKGRGNLLIMIIQ